MKRPEVRGPEVKVHMELEQLRYFILHDIFHSDLDALQRLLEKFDLSEIQKDEPSLNKIATALRALEEREESAEFKSEARVPRFQEISELVLKYLKTQFLS